MKLLSGLFLLVSISPANDPFIESFGTVEKSLPALMYYPTEAPATAPSAVFQLNTTTSPLVAAHPTNPNIVVSAMNQDPCNNIDASTANQMQFFRGHYQEVAICQSSDKGATNITATVPLHVALGGKISDGNYVSALKFSKSGKALFMAGRFADMRPNIQGREKPLSGIWVCKSSDNGKTFSNQVISTQASDCAMGFLGIADGLCDLAVNPTDDAKAAIAWDRPQYQTAFDGSILPLSGALFFSATTDSGSSWSAPRQLYDITQDIKTGGRCAGVSLMSTSNNRLVASCMRYFPVPVSKVKKMTTSTTDRVVISSDDTGQKWDKKATKVASFVYAQEYNPSLAHATKFQFPALDGSEMSHMAYSPKTNRLYLLWQAGSLKASKVLDAAMHPEIVLSISEDQGKSWSKPITVSKTYEALRASKVDPFTTSAYQAFNGNIAYLAPDLIGIIYYDHRNFQPSSGFSATDAWLAVYREGSKGAALEFVTEYRLTEKSFDENQIQTGDYLFAGIGTSLGLDASQGTFYTAYAQVGQIVPSLPNVCQINGSDSFCAYVDESQRLTCFLKPIKP